MNSNESEATSETWRDPCSEEKPGGRWLVDRKVRILDEGKWQEAIVVKYNHEEDAIDSLDNVGPNNVLEFAQDELMELRLDFVQWQLDSKEDILYQYDCGEWCGDYLGETKIDSQSDKIPHGIGRLDAASIYSVEGEFVDGIPDGNCKIQFYQVETTYEGHVKEGKEDGHGKLTYSDKTFEEGTFRNRKLIQGSFHFASGRKPKQYQTERENETPRDIAHKFKMNQRLLVAINNESLKRRKSNLMNKTSRLKKGTIVILERDEPRDTAIETSNKCYQQKGNSRSSQKNSSTTNQSEFYKVLLTQSGIPGEQQSIAEVIWRDGQSVKVRQLRSPRDLQVWALTFYGDTSKFEEEFRLADFDLTCDLLYTFEEQPLPASACLERVSVRFIPDGAKIQCPDGQYLCRFVWDPRLPIVNDKGIGDRKRPSWNRSWTLNAKDYRRNCTKVLKTHLSSLPAKQAEESENEDDPQDTPKTSKVVHDVPPHTQFKSPSKARHVPEYCCAPLSSQRNIKAKLLNSNANSDFESDYLCDQYVMAFWSGKGSQKGWWFAQIKDIEADQSKRNLCVYVRSQRGQGTTITHAKISSFSYICELGNFQSRALLFSCVLDCISDKVNKDDARNYIEEDEAEDLGLRSDFKSQELNDYLNKIVSVNSTVADNYGAMKYAFVVDVQNRKSVKIVWLITRDQAFKCAGSSSQSSISELESAVLEQNELLFTDWTDRVSAQSIEEMIDVKLVLNNNQFTHLETDLSFFCRYVCKCVRGMDKTRTIIRFRGSWTIHNIISGDQNSSTKLATKESLLDWISDAATCQECEKNDRQEFLLCDTCFSGWHIRCLKPPILSMPCGDWHCPSCLNKKHPGESLEEIDHNDDSMEADTEREPSIAKRARESRESHTTDTGSPDHVEKGSKQKQKRRRRVLDLEEDSQKGYVSMVQYESLLLRLVSPMYTSIVFKTKTHSRILRENDCIERPSLIEVDIRPRDCNDLPISDVHDLKLIATHICFRCTVSYDVLEPLSVKDGSLQGILKFIETGTISLDLLWEGDRILKSVRLDVIGAACTQKSSLILHSAISDCQFILGDTLRLVLSEGGEGLRDEDGNQLEASAQTWNNIWSQLQLCYCMDAISESEPCNTTICSRDVFKDLGPQISSRYLEINTMDLDLGKHKFCIRNIEDHKILSFCTVDIVQGSPDHATFAQGDELMSLKVHSGSHWQIRSIVRNQFDVSIRSEICEAHLNIVEITDHSDNSETSVDFPSLKIICDNEGCDLPSANPIASYSLEICWPDNSNLRARFEIELTVQTEFGPKRIKFNTLNHVAVMFDIIRPIDPQQWSPKDVVAFLLERGHSSVTDTLKYGKNEANGSKFVQWLCLAHTWPNLFPWLEWDPDDPETQKSSEVIGNIKTEILKLVQRATLMRGEYSSIYGMSFKEEDFSLGDIIGQGATAKVYKATWIQTKRVVALKKFHFTISRGMPDVLETIKQEAEKMKRLKECTHIVRCFGIVMGKKMGLVLECADKDLASLIEFWKSDSLWSERVWMEALGRSLDAVKGLLFLHQSLMIHRDIKSQNVLIFGSHTKIGDFGQAQILHSINSNSTTTSSTKFGVGTWPFSAPEAVLHECKIVPGQETKVDVYSLGCIFFHLCTGAMPFTGKDWSQCKQQDLFRCKAKTLDEALELTRKVVPGCPPVLEGLCKACCKFEATDRCELKKVEEELSQALRPLQKKEKVWSFCCQNAGDSIDAHGESQDLLMESVVNSDYPFEFVPHPKTSFDKFLLALKRAQEHNVFSVLLSGHGDQRDGIIFCFAGSKTPSIDRLTGIDVSSAIVDAFSEHASNNGTIDCVVLNACGTYPLAKMIAKSGIKHVIGWSGDVEDEKAKAFSLRFYKTLAATYPRDYFEAFESAKFSVREMGINHGDVLMISCSRSPDDEGVHTSHNCILDLQGHEKIVLQDDLGEQRVFSPVIHKDKGLYVRRICPTGDMRFAAGSKVNCLLDSDESSIMMAGEVIELGPINQTVDPPVTVVIRLFDGLLKRVEEIGITYEVGVFSWELESNKWVQIPVLSDCEEGVLRVESSIATCFVAGMFGLNLNVNFNAGLNAISPQTPNVAFVAVCPSDVIRSSDMILDVWALPVQCNTGMSSSIEMPAGSGYQPRKMWESTLPAIGIHVPDNTDIKIRVEPWCRIADGQSNTLCWNGEMVCCSLSLALRTDNVDDYNKILKVLVEFREGFSVCEEIWLRINFSGLRSSCDKLFFANRSLCVGNFWPRVPTVLPILSRLNLAGADRELSSLQNIFDHEMPYTLQKPFTNPSISELKKLALSVCPKIIHFSKGSSVIGGVGIKWFTKEFNPDPLTAENVSFLVGDMIEGARRLECLFLNLGSTYALGSELIKAGVPYVICWKNGVELETCISFSSLFYNFLRENVGKYAFAFIHAQLVMNSRGFRWMDFSHGGDGLPCLLWNDQGVERAIIDPMWSKGEVEQVESHGEICSYEKCFLKTTEDPAETPVFRTWRQPRDQVSDLPALAGLQEKLALSVLGFLLTMPSGHEICVGHGLTSNGFLETDTLRYLFGISRYEELWGGNGLVVKSVVDNKVNATRENVTSSIQALRLACVYRTNDLQLFRQRREDNGEINSAVGLRRKLRLIRLEDHHLFHLQNLKSCADSLEKWLNALPCMQDCRDN